LIYWEAGGPGFGYGACGPACPGGGAYPPVEFCAAVDV